ncbi:TPA: hypothetical protein ACPZTG_003735 [Yersinia enterocolitica]|nr:hypothetical protein [Yersinia enterocolitica]MDU5452022.1 hypothetical protein [Pseudescherichia vulneris]EKN5064502.1 hypothetical protein [Yersinia enterocolitica]ELW9026066.1 hypothetical protein [Yersinia enterocolitica]HEN3464447.1 hypothetical protein [Yersinia enterocolitica]
MNIRSVFRVTALCLLLVFTSSHASSNAIRAVMSAGSDYSEDKVKQAENILSQLVIKNEGSISNLNLSEKQLNSIVYVRLDSWRQYSTLKEFLAVFYELSIMKSVQAINEGDYLAFKIKLSGRPVGGYVLYQSEGEYFLKGVVANDGIVVSQSVGDDQFIFSDYYGIANAVFQANGLN